MSWAITEEESLAVARRARTAMKKRGSFASLNDSDPRVYPADVLTAAACDAYMADEIDATALDWCCDSLLGWESYRAAGKRGE